MQELRMVWSIIRKTGTQHILYTFIVYFFLFCLLIHLVDPEIQNYGDAIWFGFNVITTIGLGDYTVTSWAGRILTAILGLYGIFFFALVPGIITSYYLEKMEQNKNEVLQNTRHLKDLTPKEKEQIAKLAQRRRQHASR